MSVPFGFLTLAIGFSVSGAIASGFEAVTGSPASFRMLRSPGLSAVAAVPVVTLGAAYILVRNILFGGVRRSFAAAATATVMSGLWSMVIGAATLAPFTS